MIPRPSFDTTGRLDGALVRVSARTARRCFRLLVFTAVGALLTLAFTKIDLYAEGQAVIDTEDDLDVTVAVSGTVNAVFVKAGQHVDEGTPILRLYQASERDELRRIELEIDLQLAKMLKDPADPEPRSRLASLRASRDLALARFSERLVRSPRAGIVGAVWVRTGQQLGAGDRAASLAAPTGRRSLVAVLPGYALPYIHEGQKIRFNPDGIPHTYFEYTIDWMAGQAVGAREVARYFGPERSDAFKLTGLQVLVRATVPEGQFSVEGQRFAYLGGLTGRVRTPIRSDRLSLILVPFLRLLAPGA
jgi:multidrug resistance efflux pump